MSTRVCLISRPDLEPMVHGAAVKILKTAQGLLRLACEVAIVTNDRLSYYRSLSGELRLVRYPQALLSLTNIPAPLKERLAAVGLPTYWQGLKRILQTLGYPAEEHFLYQPMTDPDFWLRVLFVGASIQADVYQAEFPGYAVPAFLASRLLGGRAILVEHNVEYLRLKETTELTPQRIERLKRLEVSCANLMDRVIAVSQVDRRLLQEAGVPDRILAMIPHGVELSDYQGLEHRGIRDRYRLPPDVPLLAFHGTLHYWPNTIAVKRIAEDLLPRLRQRGLKVKALIIGSSPPRYYAHPDIIFTDVVQDLPSHLSAADVAVVPLEQGGGTRLKILEYFAAGLPVVSTSKGAEGIPVRSGKEIILADDMDTFADEVERLLTHPRDRAALAAAARAFVAHYDWSAISESYLRLYERLEPHVGYRGLATPETWQRLGAQWRRLLPAGATSESKQEPKAEQATVLVVPRTLLLMLQQGCDLRCAFCDQPKARRSMPMPLASRVLEEAAELGVKAVVFTGGEPLLHTGLWPLVRKASLLGMGTNVTTNGTLVEAQLKALLESGIHSVSISIDGLEPTHDRLRGVPGTFARVNRALLRLSREGIALRIHFVVTKENVREMLWVHDYATSLGAAFDFWPVNGQRALAVHAPSDVHAYREALEQLATRDPEVAARKFYLEAGLDYMAGWDHRVRCLGLIDQVGVDLDGHVYPCCLWSATRLRVGNLTAQSLKQILSSRTSLLLRERIGRYGCQEDCFNHSLYEYSVRTGQNFLVPCRGSL